MVNTRERRIKDRGKVTRNEKGRKVKRYTQQVSKKDGEGAVNNSFLIHPFSDVEILRPLTSCPSHLAAGRPRRARERRWREGERAISHDGGRGRESGRGRGRPWGGRGCVKGGSEVFVVRRSCVVKADRQIVRIINRSVKENQSDFMLGMT